jgi:hypothetical protein
LRVSISMIAWQPCPCGKCFSNAALFIPDPGKAWGLADMLLMPCHGSSILRV